VPACGCASVGLSYSVTVVTWHAHPTNFHETARVKPAPGVVRFSYQWDSTSGDLADLANCRLGEWVTYSGAGAMGTQGGQYTEMQGWGITIPWYWFKLTRPPYGSGGAFIGLKNPMRGSAGWELKTQGATNDTLSYPPFDPGATGFGSDPVSFAGSQVYGYRCNTCMHNDPPTWFAVLEYKDIGGYTVAYPILISHVFSQYSSLRWKWVVTKLNFASEPLYVDGNGNILP